MKQQQPKKATIIEATETVHPIRYYIHAGDGEFEGAGIYEGDLLVVDSGRYPKSRSGHVCLCEINGAPRLGVYEAPTTDGEHLIRTAPGGEVPERFSVASWILGTVVASYRRAWTLEPESLDTVAPVYDAAEDEKAAGGGEAPCT